jgi:ankyrin repeat protein
VNSNEEGYALWSKYESYLNLDPAVQGVIAAVRAGDLERLHEVLRTDPSAANPRWVRAKSAPHPIPNDSIPLFCASEAVFNGTNRIGQVDDIVRALVDAGADVEIERGTPLTAAVSYNVLDAARVLLEAGARVDGNEADGAPMAYALFFGFTAMSELLARFHAKLDLRFAAGLGRLDVMQQFFRPNGALESFAGALADPYETRFRCERTDANVLSQALLFACLNNRLEAADLLLRRGADINALVPGIPVKLTILHKLVDFEVGAMEEAIDIETRRLPAVPVLLERGASLTVRDEQYQATAIDWAHYQGRELMLQMMTSSPGSVGE